MSKDDYIRFRCSTELKELAGKQAEEKGMNIKYANLCIIGIPDREERKGNDNVFEEIMAESIPNLKKETYPDQEAQRVLNKMNPNRPKPRHTIIKMEKFKDKERILKAARKKQRLNYKKTLHKVIS